MAETPRPEKSAPERPPEKLVDDRYRVEPTRLGDAGGGLTVHTATDIVTGRAGLMAVVCAAGTPARPRPIAVLRGQAMEGLLIPLAHGAASIDGRLHALVIAPAPPGPSLATARPWSETALIERVLRPAARVLGRLGQRGLTHRAIRPDNLFQAGPADPVMLGTAWAAPPASQQPAAFEPPYSAMCLPNGRGDGAIADDVYALGAVLVALALGRPVLDDPDLLTRKLDIGSYKALVGDSRLPPTLDDLVRAMLADDPGQRPSPAKLLDPAAQPRRLAPSARVRATTPLDVGGLAVWSPRGLAHALATRPAAARPLIQSGAIPRWLRRAVGDAPLALRAEEAGKAGPGPRDTEAAGEIAAMRLVAALDPLAPLCWRGLAWWPDGFGAAFAAATLAGRADLAAPLEQALSLEAATIWSTLQADPPRAAIRAEDRRLRGLAMDRDPAIGRLRLVYGANPLLPCEGALAGQIVLTTDALLPALEQSAKPGAALVDDHVTAFALARADSRAGPLLTGDDPESSAIAALRLLAALQRRFGPTETPVLAAWAAAQADTLLAGWRNRPRRTDLTVKLRALAEAGQLAPMLALIEDAAGRIADRTAAAAAARRVREIDAVMAHRAEQAAARAAHAHRLGREIAVGLGAAALSAALFMALAQ